MGQWHSAQLGPCSLVILYVAVEAGSQHAAERQLQHLPSATAAAAVVVSEAHHAHGW